MEMSVFREAEVHRALSSATRIRILRLLRRGPMTTMELAWELSINTAGIRLHMDALWRVGLVSRQEMKKGRGRPQLVYELAKGDPLQGLALEGL